MVSRELEIRVCNLVVSRLAERSCGRITVPARSQMSGNGKKATAAVMRYGCR